ncbi:hypothetical protein QBC43DRAFT_324188 [Cladorrhinum sp. PSN259]|nr:hypothetical protein QBC43DRAFT_324188 [Cladorrhinum sp. PSN259]
MQYLVQQHGQRPTAFATSIIKLDGAMDLELGAVSSVPTSSANWGQRLRQLTRTQGSNPGNVNKTTPRQIESYRSGYPRFSAVVAAEGSFCLCRRFSNLRSRLLLLKQDKLSVLEKRLNDIDEAEPVTLFLGKSRCDRNQARLSVLADIDRELTEYDSFIERTCRTLGFQPASPRAMFSLKNWVKGNGCLAREETEYLDCTTDLVSLCPAKDMAVTRLEAWVEDVLIRFYKDFRQRDSFQISSDEHIYIYSGSLIRLMARAVLVVLITFLLLTPVLICNGTENRTVRVVVMILASFMLQATVSGLAQSRTIELFIFGATYSTLLIVFLSGTNGVRD